MENEVTQQSSNAAIDTSPVTIHTSTSTWTLGTASSTFFALTQEKREELNSNFLDAVSEGEIEKVKELKKSYAISKAVLNNALLSAATLGHFDMVRYLVEQGADINARDGVGNTPLIQASCSKNGHPKIVEYLVSKGADVTLQDVENSKTALGYAISNNCLNVLPFLKGCYEIRDVRNRTPLFIAIERDNPEIVRILLINGANINAKLDGESVLQFATRRQKYKIRLLLQTWLLLQFISELTRMSVPSSGIVIQYLKNIEFFKEENSEGLEIIDDEQNEDQETLGM